MPVVWRQYLLAKANRAAHKRLTPYAGGRILHAGGGSLFFKSTSHPMNDPAPAFGRGGWVCAALLIGLFAGGGITWAVLAHRGSSHALVVYQLPVAAGDTGRIADFPGAAAPDAQRMSPDFSVGDGGGDILEPIVLNERGPGGSLRLPDLRQQSSERILRTHPQAEKCFAIALAAFASYKKQGYELRDKVWDGEISLDEGKAVSCQFFKGNDYCFSVGTDAKGAKLALQVYAGDGQPVDAELAAQALPDGANATASLRCHQTGTYFVIVKLETATQEKVPWGMVSAYR